MAYTFNFIDLFAGAGGLSEGFIRAGFTPIAHIEMNKYACDTLRSRMAYHYLKQHNRLEEYIKYLKEKQEGESGQKLWEKVPDEVIDSVINKEISDETLADIFIKVDKLKGNKQVDFIIGGPPCQAYSIVGRARDPKNMKKDPRNFLYKYYLQFLKRYEPKMFVFENVPGILSAQNGIHLENILKGIDKAGYKIELKKLKASDYGVLQNRERVIKDMEKTMRLYSAALDLADEHKYDKLAKASLTNLASLYVVSGKKQIPHDLLQRIEFSARQDTVYGYHTLVDVNLLKNRIDSARYYLALAETHSTDIRDMADLQYTAYRIEAQAKNFEKATKKIHHYIYLTDSLTRSNMQFSAGMVERDYFKERSKFAEYRMKNRTTWEITIASVIFLIIGVAYYTIRQRLRLQRERTDHYLLLAEEANAQYKTLTEHMEGQRNAEIHLKGLIASRFDIIDKLGKTYYERENTASQQAAMFHEVKQIITDFAENNAMLQELELIVNTCHDNAMEKLRNDFPSMKETDTRLLCYIFVGFSPQVISLFMKDTVANVYARKSRLKSRIKSAETANKELFLALFG